MQLLNLLGAATAGSLLMCGAASAAPLPSGPVNFTTVVGANSTLEVTFSGIEPAAGLAITNGTYAGWILGNLPTTSGGLGTLSATVPNPPPGPAVNWTAINWLLNNKRGTPQDVQAAILFFGYRAIAPESTMAAAWEMIQGALEASATYVPDPMQSAVALLEWLPENNVIIEVPALFIPGIDRFTAGGFLNVNGTRCNFALQAGMHSGRLCGGVTYNDSAAGIKIRGRNCTGYWVIDANTRRATYDIFVNSTPAVATVTVSDNGEPGRRDSVEISVPSVGYFAKGTLAGGSRGGGNVQLHKPKALKGNRRPASQVSAP